MVPREEELEAQVSQILSLLVILASARLKMESESSFMIAVKLKMSEFHWMKKADQEDLLMLNLRPLKLLRQLLNTMALI